MRKPRTEEQRERDRARCRAYDAAHREEARARKRAFYTAHREEVGARGAVYRAANREEHNARAAAWRAAHPARKRELFRRMRLRRYGITIADYAALLHAAGNACQICGKPRGRYRLHVDHCHRTGVLRGLACNSCNGHLGNIGDSWESAWYILALNNEEARAILSPPARAGRHYFVRRDLAPAVIAYLIRSESAA